VGMKRAAWATALLLVGALTLGASAATPAQTVTAKPTRATASEALGDNHVQRKPVSPKVAKALQPAGEMRGMAINDVGLAHRNLLAVAADFPRIARNGITSVTLYIYLYLPDRYGTTVTTGPWTPTDQEITLLAGQAQQAGLRFQMMPVLLDLAENTWRGFYEPRDMVAFFTNYGETVMKYARLAQQVGAVVFYVGSENNRIQDQTARWAALIRQVRTVYTGVISYLSTAYSAQRLTFWRHVDLKSISIYFSLGEDVSPTYERMRSAWITVHQPFLRRLIRDIGGGPVIIGEMGYRSQQRAFSKPAEVNAGPTNLHAPMAQANAYRALLDTMAKEPSVYGVTWWRWATGTTALDLSYSPAGKPAECVIARYWAKDPAVREQASLPVCDLSLLDSTLAQASSILS
jgi:hypothetical protein